jgi:alpha-L-rhamnosidase
MHDRLCRSSRIARPFTQRLAGAMALLLLLSTALLAQDPLADLRQQFANPPEDARPMMRWWWFGPAVTKLELKKELETMHGVGIGGVEIQPVYPLVLDDETTGIKNLQYLSPEFLDDINFANTTARSLGLRVDVTLGSGWPYGGPKTTLDLAAGRLKVVSIPITGTTVTPPRLAEGDRLIAAFAVSGNEKSFNPASAKRIDLTTHSIPPGTQAQTALFFIASHTRQAVKRPAAGAEGFVLDHFSSAAIDEHLADVATPLVNAFADSPPYSVFSDSLEVYGSDWTANFPAEFEKRRGYDLIPHLPELLAGGTKEADAVRHDWGKTLSELIRDNYLAPLTKFAEDHHTFFRSQTYGEPAVTLADEAVADLPEGEGPQWRTFSFTRWASSASHLYGRNITSAETWTWLHSPAFRATPLDMKAEADRMFLLGVNQIVGHGYPYSAPAAGEPGWSLYAAAVFNSHNPWFPVMPDIMKYLRRVSWLLRQGAPANDIAILLPEDDGQAAFTPGHVAVTDEMRKRISPSLMATILDAGYNIDYIDAATISKLGAIPYPVLIIPPTDRIPLTTYKTIESYAAGTGKVIAIERLPSLAPGLMEQKDSAEIAGLSSLLFEGTGHRGIFVNSTEELDDALHKALLPDMVATGETSGIGFIHRKLAEMDVYFVANTSNRPVDGNIQFRSKHSSIESWDPDRDEMLQSARGTRLPLTLAPYESRVFILHDGTADNSDAWSELLPRSSETIEEQLADLSIGWAVRFGENTAPVDVAKLASWTEIAGKQFYSGEAIYSLSFNFNPKCSSSEGSTIFIDFGTGTPFEDKRKPDASGMLALLDPPIREAAIVFINGKRIGSLWHPPYRIAISKFIHPGENQIDVHVYNTAINLLAGQPPRDYTALRARYGRRFDPQDMDNLRPVLSGLFGPIHLEAQRATNKNDNLEHSPSHKY